MSNFVVTMDSGLDAPESVKKEYRIQTIPVGFEIDGHLTFDGELTPDKIIDKFYEKENKKMIIRTTPPTEDEYYAFFLPHIYMGHTVIHLATSSSMSKSYENAVAAAEKLKNVYVVDTRSVSLGVMPFIEFLHELSEEKALDINKLMQFFKDEYISKVKLSCLLNTTDMVHVGEGEDSFKKRVTDVYLNWFHKKVSIIYDPLVSEDWFHADKLFTGTYETALVQYIKYVFQHNLGIDNRKVWIGYTPRCSDKLLENCKKVYSTGNRLPGNYFYACGLRYYITFWIWQYFVVLAGKDWSMTPCLEKQKLAKA